MGQDLRIYAEGLAFSEGKYDLRTLENLISSYRKILDRLVAVQLGKRQITPDLQNQLNYDVQINPGSIELLINFALENREYIAAFAADGGAALSKIVVSLLRDSIDLRQKAAELIEKGLNVSINISNSFNIGTNISESKNVSYDDYKGTIYINDPKILWAAQQTRSPVNSLLNQVDGKTIKFIDVASADEEFRFTPDQRDIAGRQREELPTTLNVVGRLDMVAFSSHRGTIVSDGERFSVTWDKGLRSKIQQVADTEGVVFKVRPIIDHKRLDNEAIGFHVLDCGNLQSKLSL